MTDCFSFHSGTVPLLVSVPHDGRKLPGDVEALMNDTGKLLEDTDWHVARLYEFAKDLGASMITANYSRYVVDLNRPADDAAMYEGQLATGLCPLQTFAGQSIYESEAAIAIDDRVQRYWRPYHDKIEATLAEIRDSHGYALLWDAHSIVSRVPALFDGELPVLNLGTWDGRSCGQAITDAVMRVAQASPYSAVLNARFKGGHITRCYGNPELNLHAIQLEVAQRAYMDEETTTFNDDKASLFRDTLKALLEAFIDIADSNAAIMPR